MRHRPAPADATNRSCRSQAGERLTERQALLALLLPSANNLAVLLARRVARQRAAAFVARDERHGPPARHDATPPTPTRAGFDPGTVSTAVDQLMLAGVGDARTRPSPRSWPRKAADLPVAGTVHNTDTCSAPDGFVGIKTGSDDAAGGCFMFRAVRRLHGRTVTVTGVVLGQHGDNLIDAGLYAAAQLVDRVAGVERTTVVACDRSAPHRWPDLDLARMPNGHIGHPGPVADCVGRRCRGAFRGPPTPHRKTRFSVLDSPRTPRPATPSSDRSPSPR